MSVQNIAFNIIYQYKDGIKVGEFKSYTEAARSIGIKSPANIQECCCGTQKSVKGFIFKFVPNFIYYDEKLLAEAYDKHTFTTKLCHNGTKIN